MAFNLVFKTTDCTVGMAKPLPTWINLYYIRYVNYFSAAVLLICGVGIGVSYIETVLLLPSSSFFFFFVFLDCITLSNLIQLHLYSSFHSLAIFLYFFFIFIFYLSSLQGWSSVTNFVAQIHKFEYFAECYQCYPEESGL